MTTLSPTELRTQFPDWLGVEDVVPLLPYSNRAYASNQSRVRKAIAKNADRYGAVMIRVRAFGTNNRPKWIVSREGAELLVADLTAR